MTDASPFRVMIVGAGYLGRCAGDVFRNAGANVTLTTRSEKKRATFIRRGFDSLIIDLRDPRTFADLPIVDAILLCPAPDDRTAEEYQAVYDEGLRCFLSFLSKSQPPPRVVFTSSTSVYDVRDGSWVDETTPPSTTSPFQHALLSGEKSVLAFGRGGLVARLGGLYGPGRSRLYELIHGNLVVAGGDNYANNIHVCDAARALEFLVQNAAGGSVWLVADEKPTRRRDMYDWMAHRCGIRPPLYSEAVQGRATQNKRCSSKKLRDAGFHFRFPTFEKGYDQIFRDDIGPEPAIGESGDRSGEIVVIGEGCKG